MIVTHTESGFFPVARAYASVTAAMVSRLTRSLSPGVWEIWMSGMERMCHNRARLPAPVNRRGAGHRRPFAPDQAANPCISNQSNGTDGTLELTHPAS